MSTTPTGINGSPILGTPGTTYTPPATAGSASAPNGMGEHDFLQLMMDQLQNQDPLNPSDPTQYLSELAQFTSLEQETSIATSTASSAQQSSTASALALLGHTVTYRNAGGQSQTGTVSKVDFSATAGPTLTIGTDTGIALTSVSEAQ